MRPIGPPNSVDSFSFNKRGRERDCTRTSTRYGNSRPGRRSEGLLRKHPGKSDTGQIRHLPLGRGEIFYGEVTQVRVPASPGEHFHHLNTGIEEPLEPRAASSTGSLARRSSR